MRRSRSSIATRAAAVAAVVASLVLLAPGVASAAPAGTLDPTFGSGGAVATSVGDLDVDCQDPTGPTTCTPAHDETLDLVARPGGGVLVLATTRAVTGVDDLAVVALDGSGTLDATYGNHGLVRFEGLDPSPRSLERSGQLLARSDGSVLVLVRVRTTDDQLVKIRRLLPDGTLDTGFATAGTLTLPGQGHIWARAAVAPDDTLVVGGHRYDEQLNRFLVVARFDAGGDPIATFGTAGTVEYPIEPLFNAPEDLAVDPVGRVVLLVSTTSGMGPRLVVRLLADGSPDPSFGDGGDVGEGGGAELPEGVRPVRIAVDGTGRLLVTGVFTQPSTSSHTTTVVRLLDDGTLDTSYGDGGRSANPATIPGELHDRQTAVVGPDGSVTVAFGLLTVFDAAFAGIGVLRIGPDGSPDPAFGEAGASDGMWGWVAPWATVGALAVGADGVYVGGRSPYVATGCAPLDCSDLFVLRVRA